MWRHIISAMIDCLVMMLFTVMSAALTWIIWH